MLLIVWKEVDCLDTVFVSLREIMVLIHVVKRQILEKDPQLMASRWGFIWHVFGIALWKSHDTTIVYQSYAYCSMG